MLTVTEDTRSSYNNIRQSRIQCKESYQGQKVLHNNKWVNSPRKHNNV